ncbi:hypothetical protein [Arcicella lustrica]|uniref:Carboxypeptidase regulatory-like domain-containing protein n=1 Tax=Arcicella lustrica TaxID=2984196 RepID=A0ABU5SDI0_9BACT|nr:hypothetical protein [Arcicella sp. DC25W]MEA5425301.1 hypothetical protein [Arcicella sp. DC25W]
MPHPSQSSPKFYIIILIGLVSIIGAIYLVYFQPLKNSSQWIMTIVLFIFGIACLTELWRGKISFENNFIKSTGMFAVLVILCAFIFNKISPPTEESSLKIQVKDWQGTSVLANEKQVIKVSSGKFSKIYGLNSESEVLLTFMRDADSVEIEVLNYNWQIDKHGKSAIYSIPKNEILNLVLAPAKERCCLYGRVIFDDNKTHNLANIIVQAEGVSTTTQADGNYLLELPIEKQLQQYINITATVANYEGSCIGNTANPCKTISLVLKK